ncbi:MAG: hypothetical protein ABI758_05730 [Candidatus Woesebacteria bacterium]
MRTTNIPAQITTVQDTIAGNLNLTQLILIVLSLFLNTFIYALLPTRLAFTLYKIPFMGIVFVICVGLSFRIKQRIVLEWLGIFATYSLRPHLYVVNKNTDSFRSIVHPTQRTEKSQAEKVSPSIVKTKSISSFIDYTSLIRNPSLNIRLKRHSIQVVQTYE